MEIRHVNNGQLRPCIIQQFLTNSCKCSILTVAHKKKGTRPPAMSFEIASERTSGESA